MIYGMPVVVGGLLLGGVMGALALALAIAGIGMAALQTRRNGAVKRALCVTREEHGVA